MPEWRPGFGPSHGRYGKTRFSTSSVSRTFFALAYGPKYQTPRRCRSRVNMTRGKSSSTVTAMYGNDLSSRRRTLNGGRWRLTRFCSRWSASTSVPVTITSTSAIRFTMRAIPARVSPPCWKYERTRGRKVFALPTYSTSPRSSLKMYTPGWRGSFFSRSSSLSITCPKYPGPNGQGSADRARRAGARRSCPRRRADASDRRRGGRREAVRPGEGEGRARPREARRARRDPHHAGLDAGRHRAERRLAEGRPHRRRSRAADRDPHLRLADELRQPDNAALLRRPGRLRRVRGGARPRAPGRDRLHRRQRAEP